MRSSLLLIGLLSISLLLTPSCKQKGEKKNKVATLKADRLDVKKVKDDIVEIIISLPDSYETVQLINETGAAYIGGLTIEGISTGSLLTRAEKAKTYGYVMFDLAYANTYNQTNSFSKLLDLHAKLTKELGFEALLAEQEKYKERYADNKSNRDSIDHIVSELLTETNEYMQENGSAADLSLVFAGVTAKSLFVMSSLTLFALNNDKLIGLLKDQGDRVGAAINVLEMVDDEPEVTKMAQVLNPVKDVYATSTFDIDAVEEIHQSTKALFE